jgi:hypothetical protein
VLVPKTGRKSARYAGHHNLGGELLYSKKYAAGDGNWEKLLREIEGHADCDKVILSAESFSMFDQQAIRKVKDYLSRYLVKVIIYVRRQDKLLLSLWQQRIKNPRMTPTISFREFINEQLYQKPRIDFLRLINDWRDIIGRENLILKVLEKESLTGHLLQDFLYSCGINEYSHYIIPKNKNESPGIETLEAMLDVKKDLIEKIETEAMDMVLFCIHRLSKKQKWDSEKINFIDRPLYEEIKARFENDNREIAREYFGREQLFLEPFVEKPITPFREMGMSSSALMDLLKMPPLKFFMRPWVIPRARRLRDENQKTVYLRSELYRIADSPGLGIYLRLKTLARKMAMKF